ncbi:hypothetical protein NQ317_016091 [Molorchus minor]|uniref:Major facilitator superfamily (MFS) profile domain-containing protein n=1 Tax=Molorchus minor TaxID=1323400 RepID=A0ABQ9IWJ7_9CUCU|nr:hypothetical protein NQ317_016091 [Molorchus minor]
MEILEEKIPCFGFFNVYALRVNLSIAIVDMTDFKNITLDNGTIRKMREFNWDTKLQGYILSSFFYGYITTPLIGGYLAAKLGGKTIFGIGIGATAILTILTPWLATLNGVTYPAVHDIWSRWAPPKERTRLATIAFSGSYVGTVVAMPVSAYLLRLSDGRASFIFLVIGNTTKDIE